MFACYLGCLALWLLMVVAYDVRLIADMEKAPQFLDYFHIVANARLSLTADRIHMYDPGVHLAAFNALIAPSHYYVINVFHMPPHTYLCVLPLLTVPLRTGYIIWISICAAACIAAVLMLTSRLPARDMVICVLLICASYPAQETFLYGQLSWIWFAAMALVYQGLLRGQPKASLAGLAVLTLKFQYLPMLLIATWFFQRKSLVWFAAICLAVAAVIFGWYGAAGVANYVDVLFKPEIPLRGLICIRELVTCVSEDPLVQRFSVLTTLIGFGIVIAVCRAALMAGGEESKRWALALTGVCAILFSPHSFTYDAWLLYGSWFLTLQSVNPKRLFVDASVWYRIWCIIFFLFPALSWFGQSALRHNSNLFYIFLETVLLIVGLCEFKRICQRAEH
jgi:hypothetical protein